MAKVDKIKELIDKYKDGSEKIEKLLNETPITDDKKAVWIAKQDLFSQFIEELEELKEYYSYEKNNKYYN